MKRGKKMKKLSKTLLAVAAVSVVSAAMAASAMAADFTATYSNGTLSFEGIPDTGESQTILVLTEDVDEITNENANDVVLQIDQKDNGEGFTVTKLDPSKLEENHTYYVRIGGSTVNTVLTSTFQINETPSSTIRIVVGDVNLSGGSTPVDINDGIMFARHMAASDLTKGQIGDEYVRVDNNETVTIGDIDLNGGSNPIDINDGLMFARHLAASDLNKGHMGESIEVYDNSQSE